MAAAKVSQSLHDFVLFPHQDRTMAPMTSNTTYPMPDYPGMPAHYPAYEDDMYNTVPIMSSTAGYTESTYSTSGASAQSAASSAVSSPYSQPCHNMPGPHDRWMDLGLGIAGGLAHSEMYPGGAYPASTDHHYDDGHSQSYVDPSLVSYDPSGSMTITDSPYNFMQHQLPSFPSHFPGSPSLSELSSHESHRSALKSRHQSPRFHPYPAQRRRRDSYTSHRSSYPHESPRPGSLHSEEEGRDSRRCPQPDCGRLVKDMKAHMLTHQSERPEKCPIVDCEYNIKGFARKYDRCRHTLTHFKGTMVCNFCPNSGSSLEKSFNRADVFKRHLTSCHNVEQSAPNSRKKSPSTRKASSIEDKVAGCSTCSTTFRNPQEFYDHLDECVIKYLGRGEASEGINERNLKTINNDKAVKETMERNSLPLEITSAQATLQQYDEEEEDDDDEDPDWSGSRSDRAGSAKTWHSGAGLTRSNGGIKLAGKGRRGKKNYPASWPASSDKTAMKKRVLVVYDGDRRLWKDEMMLDNEHEVRISYPGDEKRYVTLLDKATVDRARFLHNATDAEKGAFTPGTEVEKLMI